MCLILRGCHGRFSPNSNLFSLDSMVFSRVSSEKCFLFCWLVVYLLRRTGKIDLSKMDKNGAKMLQNWFKKIGITKSDAQVLGLCAGFLLPFMYNDFAEYWARHGIFAGILNALFFYFKIFIVALIVVYYLLPFYLTKKSAFVLLILLLLLLITEGVLARYTYQFICG